MRYALSLIALLCSSTPSAADDAGELRAGSILESRCLRCHDSTARKGGLSLSTRAGALEGGKRGPAIVPGKPGDSLLLEMVQGEKPRMPRQAEPLSAKEVEELRAWIAGGAPWPRGRDLAQRIDESTWWSLRPIVKPPAPAMSHPWIRGPVDAFTLEKLRANGLEPSAEADRRTLIRRLTFDLHGLPPTPAEVDAFVNDPSPDAHERLVDQLLDSPRYGERWGRYWLDIVHYGESHGYDKDKRRPNAWPYRDYVIRSLNEDKPFARFIEEQLAGDVLFPDEPDGIVATGFISAGPWDFVGHVELREGTVDKAIARSNDRDDMVASAMSTFTSITAHCARCHDHKFDPIPQEDYYSLQAVFAGVDRADRTYDADAATHRARRELAERKAQLAAELKAVNDKAAAVTSPEIASLDARLATLEKELAKLPAPPDGDQSPSNGYHSDIMAMADSVKWVEVDLGRVLPLDRVVLVPARPTDFPDTPGFGFPARFRIEASAEPITAASARMVLEDRTTSDFPNPGDLPYALDCAGKEARYIRIVATKLWERTNDFVFALGELQVYSGGKSSAQGAAVRALDSIEAGRWAKSFLVDGYSSRSPLGKGPELDGARAARVAAQSEVARARERRKLLVNEALDDATRVRFETATRDIAEVEAKLGSLPPQLVVYAAAHEFAPSGNFSVARAPRPVHLLQRGDVKSPGALMAPGALSCVPGLESRFRLADPNDEGERRAALAKWLTDPRNVLTWRSIVNRVWQFHFGRGIVDSPNDFGRMGARPTHPELLDWLAASFQENGGSLKKLHRLLLTSATYRQTSRGDGASASIDGDNRWLWRMNRQRLEAEAVRDAFLAISGKLDLAMGGPSVDHFFFKDDHSPVYDYSRFDVDSPASFRRGVYRFIVRSVPDPFLECLDCPDPSILTPKRNNTLTSLQALAMLNTPFAVRQAEHFAERLRAEAGGLQDQIVAAYRIALGREPRADEAKLLAGHAEKFGLENACRLILNLNELIFID